ncbi:MAG: hypothetical protein Q4D42_06380 [Eubacteriales bacterium]|nr:hypothetical protein [Eubacteriales bacterium]
MEQKKRFAHGKRPRHVGLIVFVCAVALAAMSAFLLGGTKTGVTLPTGTTENISVTEKTGYRRTDAKITVDNVQQVIESLSRPEAYSASVVNTLYWTGDWESINVMQYVRDGTCLNAYFDADGNIDRYQAIRDGKYYTWRNGGTTQYIASTGGVSADDASMIPTYETVVNEEKDDIIAAGERTVDGESCIYVTVHDEQTDYNLTYWVSTVSGLLIQADYNRSGELVRSVVVNNIKREEPAKALFQLPDGSSLLSSDAEGMDTENQADEIDEGANP